MHDYISYITDYLFVFAGGTLDKYDKKLDSIENGSFPPVQDVADFEQAIELTGVHNMLFHRIFFVKFYSTCYF